MGRSQREGTRYQEGTKPEDRSWISPAHARLLLRNPGPREGCTPAADFRLTELLE
jgi:hypothetical protein